MADAPNSVSRLHRPESCPALFQKPPQSPVAKGTWLPRMGGCSRRATYTQGVAPEVLLAREALAADFAGVGPLSGVGADVALQDALLLRCVGAKRALVQLDGHHKDITFVGRETAFGTVSKGGASFKRGDLKITVQTFGRGKRIPLLSACYRI